METAAPPTRFVRDRATWLAYLLSFYYGYVINILGPLTPFLRAELGLAYTQASLHFSAFAAGMLLAGISADRVTARLGRRWTLWVGAFGMAAGALLLMVGRQPAVTIPACLFMGVLGTWVLAVYPAVLADRHGGQRAVALAEGTIWGGAGAAAAPLCLGLLAYTAAGWRSALLLPILALVPLFLRFRREALTPAMAAVPRRPGVPRKAEPLPGAYWVFWALLVTVVAVEFCIAFWSADFLQSERGLAQAEAALAATLFLAAMLVGRIVGSRLLFRYPPRSLLFASLAVTAVGFLLFWLLQDVMMAAVGLVVAGLGVANLYPTTLSLAVGSAPGQLDQAGARASLASGTAILALPLLLGRMADAVGITPAFGLVVVLVGVAGGMLWVGRRLTPIGRHRPRDLG